ncbi:Spy/CpxP family protein refolding chaperone [Fimbriimonas ginsengisoli]|uniref:Uncharacterized protein n=1 Tax=Fimbriimonas ginsengisoli Gsoil 348 TaxID=661478 RepID=A0A068NUH6_FIMGI|nr:Spy/CpxP family protein refolding chaperone [Fimbriimonas ginsengisoli]AIE87183.1 hypothetical protein OP10G_3815 [Fimbriimonas ginsengisoli Gsoil 348]
MRNSILSLLFVAASALAGAQSLPSAPHLDLAHRGTFLLNDPKIQAQIGLSSAQEASYKRIMQTLSERQSKLFQSATPDNKAIMVADRVASDDVLKTLTADQRAKLMKASVKAAGYTALVAPDVAAKLKLKPAQVNRIRAILNKADEPIEELESIVAEQVSKDPKHAEEVEKSYRAERKRRAKNQLADQEKSLKVLTPAQKQAWLALTN